MPRNVRNVWIKVECNEDNGRVIETGPRTKEGGADVTFFVRREGSTHVAGYIVARRFGNRIVLTWRAEARGEDVTLYDGPRDSDGAGAVRESVDDEGPAAMPTAGPCYCRRGIERDNCPQCEGTGTRIDWARYHREGMCTCPAHQKPAPLACVRDHGIDLDPDGDFCRETIDDEGPTERGACLSCGAEVSYLSRQKFCGWCRYIRERDAKSAADAVHP